MNVFVETSKNGSVLLNQRSDYTQKYNQNFNRHNWLRLTPAYSVKIVEDLLSDFRADPVHILDPFCGMATTALCAANRGHLTTTVDVNPFLVWLASAKTTSYPESVVGSARKACMDALYCIETETVPPMAEPPIHNIGRWWSAQARHFFCRLRPAIELVTTEMSKERSLLLIAFCRTLIATSNASFNHQSMSFRSSDQTVAESGADLHRLFSDDVFHVLDGALQALKGKTKVFHGDARALGQMDDCFDLIITSPPYANRMSYIRELRPYMYWLGYLTNGRDAGELDWLAIGGTWGIATSRLGEWAPSDLCFTPKWLAPILGSIARPDNANGRLLANYIAKYSEDMWRHFAGLANVMHPRCQLHYIVGNSTFYGNLLPTERLYADMLEELGFDNVTVRPIRKRNSKMELIEFDVSAHWH